MIRVNLVPQEILDKARRKQFIIKGAAAGVALVLVLSLISFGQYLRLRDLRAQSAEAAGKLQKLQVLVTEVQDLQKTESGIRDRLNIINGLLKNRPLYPDFMSDFARDVPGGIQIQDLTTAGGGSAGATLKISVSARALSNDDIAGWISAMQNSGRFASVVLGAVSAQGTAPQQAFSFTLDATYTPSL
ncbi:MAG TPA: PilN domain-containing protein [Elusimicrobiota bacterium]|nr:PilN domain-containing protein [Elusimicrobiota bacterium]